MKTIKVLYISNGLPHYYNKVLNRLASLPGVDLAVVAPRGTSAAVGAGVYQTEESVKFRIIRLEEVTAALGYLTFKGLGRLFLRERPHVIIGPECYLEGILFNPEAFLMIKLLRIQVLLKSIPFRLPFYPDAIADATLPISECPNLIAKIRRLGGNFFRRLRVRYHRHLLRRVDGHVNYVARAFDLFTSYGVRPERIFVTYNSPDTDEYLAVNDEITGQPPILPENPYRLIHVGRLVEWKRVDYLIRAVAALRSKYPRIELLVVGYGPKEEEWKALAASLGLGESVKFLGGIYDLHLLGRYYHASAAYVLAGMGGISINEAMCFGMPVICSTCDGTEKEIVLEGENGLYFRDGDEADLVRAIDEMLANESRRRRMGQRSLELIRGKINIHTVIEGYRRAFNYVLGQEAIHHELPEGEPSGEASPAR